jgi:nitrogen fixation protein NifU and related proteins
MQFGDEVRTATRSRAVFSDGLLNTKKVEFVQTRSIQIVAAKKLRNDLSYSDKFKDHLLHPRHAGELSDANAVAEETNPVCGDRIKLSLRLGNGRVEAAQFLAYGCPPTIACGSAMTEIIQGMTVSAALSLTRKDLAEAIGGLPARKQHAAALAIETLRTALASAVDENV